MLLLKLVLLKLTHYKQQTSLQLFSHIPQHFIHEFPISFNQFLSVTIIYGTSFLFEALDFILQPVGLGIQRWLDLDNLDYYAKSPIHALVITPNSRLVPHIRLILPRDRLLIIRLDYEGLIIHYSGCLSHAHLIED